MYIEISNIRGTQEIPLKHKTDLLKKEFDKFKQISPNQSNFYMNIAIVAIPILAAGGLGLHTRYAKTQKYKDH